MTAENQPGEKRKEERRTREEGIPLELEAGRRAGDNFSYISFYIAGQLLGIPIERAQEVISLQSICSIPLAPTAVAGLLNLRGQIVTAVDLRRRLGIEDRESDHEAMNIIVRDEGELFSLIVDSVGDVIEVRKDSFESPPATLDTRWRECCKGVHQLSKGLLIVVKVSALFHLEVEV